MVRKPLNNFVCQTIRNRLVDYTLKTSISRLIVFTLITILSSIQSPKAAEFSTQLQGFGEDTLTRAITLGEPLYARQNTQKAFWRRGLSPLNQMNTFLPGDDISSRFLGRITPALSTQPWNSNNALSIGNEVGDPLYQELQSQQPGANRTPTILLHTTTPYQHSQFLFEVGLGFEQVDHMSSQSAGERVNRLGHKIPDREKQLTSPDLAHAWFGENLPTSSMLAMDVQIKSTQPFLQGELWSQQIQLKNGYLWYTVDSNLNQWPEQSLEAPYQIKQIYNKGHYRHLYWENQTVLANYQYLESNTPNLEYSLDRSYGKILATGDENQYITRLGMNQLDYQNFELSIGLLHYLEEQTAQCGTPDCKTISPPGTNFTLLETAFQSPKFLGFYMRGNQQLGESHHNLKHTLGYEFSVFHWLNQFQITHHKTESMNTFNRALKNSGQDKAMDQNAQWLDLELKNQWYFGVHQLVLYHKYFEGIEGFGYNHPLDLRSFQETLEFHIIRAPRTRLLSRLSYEKSWGSSWDKMYMSFPTWQYYQYLSFRLGTGIEFRPLYSWQSSYRIHSAEYTIKSSHNLHLKIVQSLLQDKLNMWIEMIQILSEDQKLHPNANEDRFRTLIGAEYHF